MNKRVFLIVLDSVGVGEMPDSSEYGDKGSHTLKACTTSSKLNIPTLTEMGIFNIDNIGCGTKTEKPTGAFGKFAELSKGKDTTIGHWEIAGIVSNSPLPTYPNGFPQHILDKLKEISGREIICNLPYSGTAVLDDYGKQHMETGALIVYTSADSVLQIAAHEDIVPVETLYEYCHRTREFMTGADGVGRIIARPFIGQEGSFKRTSNRHDYSLTPPSTTMLDDIKSAGLDVLGVGKIFDIFAERGLTDYVRTVSNDDGMLKTFDHAKKDFNGLCFVNLVDFDMMFGHRNDIEGYANALTEFDVRLKEFLPMLKPDDILMITADHGCDPSTPSTDHSREHTPILIYGDKVNSGINLTTRDGFCDIAATIVDYLNVDSKISGTSFLGDILK